VEPLLSYKALKSADRNPQDEAEQEQQQRGVDDLVHYHQSLIRPVLEYCERTNAISRERPVVRYDTRCYFSVRSKADISQLNLPHGTDN